MAITEKYASSAGAGSKDGSSEANAWDWETMLTTAAAGDRINFKGNHTLTANASFSNAGTVTSPIILRGYYSTIGDLAANGRTGGNGPLITTGFPVISGGFAFTMPANSIIQYISRIGSRNGYLLTGCLVTSQCYIENTSTNASITAVSLASYAVIFDCDVKLSASAASSSIAIYTATGSNVIGCRIYGGGGTGLSLSSACSVLFSTIYSSVDAILINSASSNMLIAYNTLVAASSDGIHVITGITRIIQIIGNIITDNGAYGIYSVDAGALLFTAVNRIDRNTSGASSGATDWLAATGYGNDTTSVAKAAELPNYAADDYRLGPSSPAIQRGIPAYLDIGALQIKKFISRFTQRWRA